MTILTDAEWCKKLNELNLLGDVREFVSLAYWLLDQPVRLIFLLKRLIGRGAVVEDLGNVLIHFYYYNLCDADLRTTFYNLLAQESSLQPLRVAHINTVPCMRLNQLPAPYSLNAPSSTTAQYDNIVGGRTESEQVTFVFPPQHATSNLLPTSVFTDQFTLLKALFGINMILPEFVLKIIRNKQQSDINVLMSLIHQEQLTTAELLQLTSCLRLASERKLFLQLLAHRYQNHFTDYLPQAIQAPCLFYLLPDMQLSEAQKQALTAISPHVYKKVFSSDVFTSAFKINRMACVFLYLRVNLITPLEEIKEVFASAIIKISTGANHLIASPDDSDTADIRDRLTYCSLSLLPYIESYFHQQLAALSPLVTTLDFIAFNDAWQANMPSLNFLKSLFPRVRYCDYPFTLHELHALYLQQIMPTQSDLKHALAQLSERLKAGHLFSQDTEAEKQKNLKHFQIKTLIAIYYMTRNQQMRVQAITLLNQISEAESPAVNWRLQEVWWNVPALEILILKNQGEALADYLQIAGQHLSGLFELIIKAVESGCIDALQALYNYRGAKNSIAAAFKSVALDQKIGILQKLLTLNGAACPDQATVSEALIAVASADKWDVALVLIALRGSNRPRQAAIYSSFESAAGFGKSDVIGMLLESGMDYCPDQVTVDKALSSAVFSCKWVVVRRLIALRGSNRPSQKAINSVFISAAVAGICDVLDRLLELDEAYCPDQLTVNRTLIRATLGPPYAPGIVMKLIGLRGDNRPSLETLNDVFLKLDLSEPGLLAMLLELDKDHWPDQVMVSQALIKWACTWPVVNELLALRGGNRPNQRSINRAFVGAVLHEQYDVIATLLDQRQGHDCPDQATVSEVLSNAASEMKWRLVQQLVTLRGANRPDQRAINQAFSMGVYFSQCDLVATLLDLDNDHCPTQEIVNLAIRRAVSAGKWGVVKVIIALKGDLLSQEVINATLLVAASAGNHDVVSRLLEHDKTCSPDQTTLRASSESLIWGKVSPPQDGHTRKRPRSPCS